MLVEVKTVYFERPGKPNTDEALAIARKRATEIGIKKIVVASTSGYTAVKAVEALKGFKVFIVAHSCGFKERNVQEFTEENRKIVEAKGVPILFTTHAFGGISRAMRQSSIPQAPTTYVVGDLIANTLRMFGQGMKVACEIASMAADAGFVRTDEDIISVAGTGSEYGRGADTALVLRPAHAQYFFETLVKEILCKPHF